MKIRFLILSSALVIYHFVFAVMYKNDDEQSVTDASADLKGQLVHVSIAGNYHLSSLDSCELSIVINEVKSGYTYHFDDGQRQQQGLVIFTDSKALLRLAGLFADDGEREVSALLQENSLLIQNYGNSMNPYQLFNQCDDKFLRLQKISFRPSKIQAMSKYA